VWHQDFRHPSLGFAAALGAARRIDNGAGGHLTTQYGFADWRMVASGHAVADTYTQRSVALDGRGVVEASKRVFADPMDLTQMQADEQALRFFQPLFAAGATVMEAVEAVGTTRFHLQITAPQDTRLFVSTRAETLSSSTANPSRVRLSRTTTMRSPRSRWDETQMVTPGP
jgi:hypothetical protein